MIAQATQGGTHQQFTLLFPIRMCPLVQKSACVFTGGAPLRQADAMFVIELVYKASLTEIDAHMAAHVAFLNKYYAAGHFVVSGRKIPRDGGIIIAVAKSREEIEALMREDPFCARGLADVRVIEFRVSQRASDVEKRIPRARR